MKTISAFTFANLAWLGSQAVPLVVWPSFVGSILRDEGEVTSSGFSGNSYQSYAMTQ